MNAYTTDAMRVIWNDQSMLDTWREVELAILQSQAWIDPDVPIEWYHEALAYLPADVGLWRDATADTGHEVVAFLRVWGAPNVHIGITSSDVTDTALGLRLKQTNDVLLDSLGNLHEALRVRIAQNGQINRLGRTHGQPATIMQLGQVLANWDLAIQRSIHRLQMHRRMVEVCMVSGPVGSYLHVHRKIELLTAKTLGLNPAESSTQILMRDSLAAWAAELAIITSTAEAIGTEIRLMQHAQVREAYDFSGSTSSAMAHKSNPNRAERLSGLGRLARAAFEPLAAGIPQWHERDMAHSSVERVLIPQLAGVTDYALRSASELIWGLTFDAHQMALALTECGVEVLCHSAQTALQKAGVPYIQAHQWVERNWSKAATRQEFVNMVLRHPSEPDFEWPTPHTAHLLED